MRLTHRYSSTNQDTAASYSPTNQVTATSQPSETQQPPQQDVQHILSQWNGDQITRFGNLQQQHTPERPPASSRSDTEKPETENIYEMDPKDGQVLYYWNGASYQPAQKSEHLPPSTLKYKTTANGGFALVWDEDIARIRQFEDTASNNQRETIQSSATVNSAPSHSASPTSMSNFDLTKIESILQAHYPANERTTPSPSVQPPPPQTPLTPPPLPPITLPQTPPPTPQTPLPEPLITTQAPNQEPFNPYVPKDNHQQPLTTPPPPPPTEQARPLTTAKNTDAMELEKVVTNDVNIKQAINTLANLFNSDGGNEHLSAK